MKISIHVFDCLDKVAKRHRITDIAWAEAAKIRRPTIPELRRLSRTVASGVKGETDLKRSCTLDKILKLYSGLRIKLGDAVVSEAVRNYITTESDQYLRLQLLILMLRDAKKEKRNKAEQLLKSVVKNLG